MLDPCAFNHVARAARVLNVLPPHLNPDFATFERDCDIPALRFW
jgi:hypothetical protein